MKEFSPTVISLSELWDKAEKMLAAKHRFDAEVFRCRSEIAQLRTEAALEFEIVDYKQGVYNERMRKDPTDAGLAELSASIRESRAHAAKIEMRADNLASALAELLVRATGNE